MARATRPIPSFSQSDKLRFWDKIANHETLTGCHEWTGAKSKAGYGQLNIGGRLFYTHRIAYSMGNKHDPGDLHVCHSCDNPACCNSAHLWLGTDTDNMRDMTDKGRNGSHTKPECLARGDAHGSRLHPERVPRGEAHGMSKLTAADIPAIRADPRKLRSIAIDYGVSRNQISAIKNRKKWGHVA